jgi:hypothetical protein
MGNYDTVWPSWSSMCLLIIQIIHGAHIDQVIAVNCDNASNNDTMTDDLEAQSAVEGFEFDSQESWLRCMPHTVHLAALEVIKLIYLVKAKLMFCSCSTALVLSNTTRRTTIYIKTQSQLLLIGVSITMQSDRRNRMTMTNHLMCCKMFYLPLKRQVPTSKFNLQY